jgi:hypothetical protein
VKRSRQGSKFPVSAGIHSVLAKLIERQPADPIVQQGLVQQGLFHRCHEFQRTGAAETQISLSQKGASSESRNDFDYRPCRVLARRWRLVLWAALAPDHGAVNVTAIDELSNLIGRLRAFMREVAESREDNRVYWMRSTHDKLETHTKEGWTICSVTAPGQDRESSSGRVKRCDTGHSRKVQ